MTTNAARFAWESLGSPPWPGPEEGIAGPCWLCGGGEPTGGWPRTAVISPSFTNHPLAAAPASDAVCQACAYMLSGASWKAYVDAGPDRGLKAVHPLSWKSYSHVFAAGLHECPTRQSWRAWLEAPPEPPFLFLLAESGQKHIIFRARVSHSRGDYWVQVEEDSVLVNRSALVDVIALFEGMLALGFTRDEIRTGNYSQGRLLKARSEWRALESAMGKWRQTAPDYLRIAAVAAHGPKKAEAATTKVEEAV